MPTTETRNAEQHEERGAETGQEYAVVVIAASAGGLRALRVVLGGLDQDFQLPIVVVQHLAPHLPSLLSDILDRASLLDVKQAQEGDRLEAGRVLTAPPDRHVVVCEDGTVRLTKAAKVRYVRPSADVLFRSAAEVFGARTVAVVLSGTGSDGAQGAAAISQAGGYLIVQEAASAEFGGMPSAAIRADHVDRILPLGEIASALNDLVVRRSS